MKIINITCFCFIILFLFHFSTDIAHSNPKRDSLLLALESSKDTNRVKNLLKISNTYFKHMDTVNIYKYVNDALRLSEELGYNYGIGRAYFFYGTLFQRLNQFNRSIENLKLAVEYYDKASDDEEKGFSYLELGISYSRLGDFIKGIEYFNKSLKIWEELNDTANISRVSTNLSILYLQLSLYHKALDLSYKALKQSEITKDTSLMVYLMNNLGNIYFQIEEYKKAEDSYNAALEINKKMKHVPSQYLSILGIGSIYENQKNYDKTLEYYEQALELTKKINNKIESAKTQIMIGEIQELLNNNIDAENNYKDALTVGKTIGNKNVESLAGIALGKLNLKLGNHKRAFAYLNSAVKVVVETPSLLHQKDCYMALYEYYESRNNHLKAFEYYKLQQVISDSLFSVEKEKLQTEIQAKYETEKKETEIINLKREKKISQLEVEKLENNQFYYTIIIILIILIALIAYNRYRLNKKANNLLEEKNRLEIESRKRVINLFGQQVSQEIVDELLDETSAGVTKKKFVCIMFLDIRGFTPLVENKTPEEIIEYQNSVFGFMIEIINKHHGIINQFLGDGYMATFGAPVSKGNDCQNAVDAALEIVEKITDKNKKHDIPTTRIGIGLHAGNVVAGNVGTKVRKQYSITGNAVILASRIEKLNKKFKSQLLISEDVLLKVDLKDRQITELGPCDIEGRERPINIIKLMD